MGARSTAHDALRGDGPQFERLTSHRARSLPIVSSMVADGDVEGSNARGRDGGDRDRSSRFWTVQPEREGDARTHELSPVPQGTELPRLAVLVHSAETGEVSLAACAGIEDPEQLLESVAPSVVEVAASGKPRLEPSGAALLPVGRCRGSVFVLIEAKRDAARQLTSSMPLAREDLPFAGRLGRSPVMVELGRQAEKIAESDLPVLLLGDTGSGKSTLAKMIHQASARRDKPFIRLDCSLLTPATAEVEIFGCEKGAFTDAKQRRIGVLEAAHEGTLFLDEIGDLPWALQMKFLTPLDTRGFLRVGANAGSKPIDCDVRFITATHHDLPQMVNDRSFRQDLYFRLAAKTLLVPRLCERGEEVIELADTLLARVSERSGCRPRGMTPAAHQTLATHSWPGNLRELQNVLRVLAVERDGEWIDAEHVRRALGGSRVGASNAQTVLPPPLAPEAQALSPLSPQPDELSRRQMDSFLRSFVRHWPTQCGGSPPWRLILSDVIGKIGGGAPGAWIGYLRRRRLLGVVCGVDLNRLSSEESLAFADRILQTAGDNVGLDAWAAAAALLLGAGDRAAQLVRKAKGE